MHINEPPEKLGKGKNDCRHFMKIGLRPQLLLIGLLVIIGIGLPIIAYWIMVGRAPQVTAAKARRLAADNMAVVVDIGLAPSSAAYLPDAFRWPFHEILRVKNESAIPDKIRGRRVILLCTGGVRSALAAIHLRSIGVKDAVSLRGGLQAYIAAVPGCAPGMLLRRDPAADATIIAFRPSPIIEQWAAVLTFFGVKTIYTFIAIWIIVLSWRKRDADFVALRLSMIAFTVGEMCCFFNVMAFFEDSMLLEHLHSIGMVLSLAFAAYALLEGLDMRLVHYSDDGRCAAAALCRACTKYSEVACGLRRLFLFLIPATAILAAVPLFSSFRETTYNTRIFGFLHSYRHPLIHQFYELRFLPAAALILLAACFIVLYFFEHRTVPVSKILFSAAVGAAGFSYLRLFLVASFIDSQVWFAAWEETTELLFVGVIAGTLLIFGRSLGITFTPATEIPEELEHS
jgi:rhodanese-related sulfurtransferase